MKKVLKGWLINNPLTTDNKDDKILMLESGGNLTLDDVVEQMIKEFTGIHEESIRHSVTLYHRVIADLVLRGYSVNTGLFRAVPQFRGTIEKGAWNPEKNSIYISFTQDKDLRDAITETSVHILGERGDAMYIADGEDTATHATDGTATAGYPYNLHGRLLKVEGSHESVGITLTNISTRQAIKVDSKSIVLNKPSNVMVLLPSDLADGTYEMTITTQYSQSKKHLKTPRSTVKTIFVGQASKPGGGGGDTPGGGGGDTPGGGGGGGDFTDPDA
ncbi:MAG: DUF4469 domain-containing protein [Mediterranea sp.]|jgi:hypothetical protein|nr:DUF4469 domain-containing protein [Mediterranea sp.]